MDTPNKQKAELGKEAIASFLQEIQPIQPNQAKLLSIIFELLGNKKYNFLRTKNENLSIPPKKK